MSLESFWWIWVEKSTIACFDSVIYETFLTLDDIWPSRLSSGYWGFPLLWNETHGLLEAIQNRIGYHHFQAFGVLKLAWIFFHVFSSFFVTLLWCYPIKSVTTSNKWEFFCILAFLDKFWLLARSFSWSIPGYLLIARFTIFYARATWEILSSI